MNVNDYYTKEFALKHAIEQFAMWRDDVRAYCTTNESDYSPYEFYLYEKDNKTTFSCGNSIFQVGAKIVGFVHFFYVSATDTYVFVYSVDCPEEVNRDTLKKHLSEWFEGLDAQLSGLQSAI